MNHTTIEQAGAALAAAKQAAEDYDLVHADIKLAALTRLVQTVNPLTNKPHSASSAESVLEQDPEYRASRERRTSLAVAVIDAQTRYDAAKANGFTDAMGMAPSGPPFAIVG